MNNQQYITMLSKNTLPKFFFSIPEHTIYVLGVDTKNIMMVYEINDRKFKDMINYWESHGYIGNIVAYVGLSYDVLCVSSELIDKIKENDRDAIQQGLNFFRNVFDVYGSMAPMPIFLNNIENDGSPLSEIKNFIQSNYEE